MIIVGAKGFAKEVLEVLLEVNQENDLFFFDNINSETPDLLFGKFPVIKSLVDAKNIFLKDARYVLGIGNPLLRRKIVDVFSSIGGSLESTVSNSSIIGSFNVNIGRGSNLMKLSLISNDVTIGIGAIVYFQTCITHDCILGDFVEVSPGAKILGRAHIGSYSCIGSNAVVLPDIIVGQNVVVGAGAVVTKDIPDNSIVAGVPARIIKHLEPLPF